MKPVRFSMHAQQYTEKRGFSFEEVREAIATADWKPASLGVNRHECSREFPFNALWNGKFYGKKLVRPIFVENDLEIVIVTVYTYYY